MKENASIEAYYHLFISIARVSHLENVPHKIDNAFLGGCISERDLKP
jgi:hypothetical protein